jgi:hypothetical protein
MEGGLGLGPGNGNAGYMQQHMGGNLTYQGLRTRDDPTQHAATAC